MELAPAEVRVVGCLVEKQLTTPQQYPLTLNALVAACNQASNRWPVTDYDEHTVQAALDRLKAQGLVRFVYPSHGRSVTRYRQVLEEVLELETAQLALLASLMLRGPQTPGELRARTERMAAFSDTAELEDALTALGDREEPLVVRLAREPGRREARYGHLLGSVPDDAGSAAAPDDDPETEPESWRHDARTLEPDRRMEPVPTGPVEDTDIRNEIMDLRNQVAALGRALDHILGRLTR